MSTNPNEPLVWSPFPKLRPGRPANTAWPVVLGSNGSLSIPTAACDALGLFERVHLFVAENRPGMLWLCPAHDDDDDAYRLTRPTRGEGGRRLTATDLPERLGVNPDLDVVRGSWTIADEKVVVVFDAEGSTP
jgi:hypothetical protein